MNSQIGDFNGGRMTPRNHTSIFHDGATANLLTALTPTFANWTQDPGTNAIITRDTDVESNLSTNGIGAAGNNTIIYDLGDIRRRLVYVKDIGLDGSMVDISSDGITYYTLVDLAHPTSMIYGVGIANFRYLKYLNVGVNTITFLRLICYNIN